MQCHQCIYAHSGMGTDEVGGCCCAMAAAIAQRGAKAVVGTPRELSAVSASVAVLSYYPTNIQQPTPVHIKSASCSASTVELRNLQSMDRSPRRVLASQLYTAIARVAVAHQCVMRNPSPRCRRCVSEQASRRLVGDVAAVQRSQNPGPQASACAHRELRSVDAAACSGPWCSCMMHALFTPWPWRDHTK